MGYFEHYRFVQINMNILAEECLSFSLWKSGLGSHLSCQNHTKKEPKEGVQQCGGVCSSAAAILVLVLMCLEKPRASLCAIRLL